jgi:hypothetical protein
VAGLTRLEVEEAEWIGGTAGILKAIQGLTNLRVFRMGDPVPPPEEFMSSPVLGLLRSQYPIASQVPPNPVLFSRTLAVCGFQYLELLLLYV